MTYIWEGMKKISFEEVKQLCLDGIGGFYLIYPDNTEADAYGSTWEEIERHYNNGGEFGIEL